MGVPIPPPPPLNILSLCLYAGFTRAEPGATGLQSVFASTVNVGADRPDSRKGARQKLALGQSEFRILLSALRTAGRDRRRQRLRLPFRWRAL